MPELKKTPHWIALLLALMPAWAEANGSRECLQARQAGSDQAEKLCLQAWQDARQQRRPEQARDALFQLAIIARQQGRYQEARQYYDQIQREFQSDADWTMHYRLARERGILAHLHDDATGALTLFRGSLAIATEHEDQHRIARSLNDLGNAYRHIGANREALDAFTQSLALKREQSDQQLGSTLNNIANLLTDMGDYDRAESYYQQALQQHAESGHQHHIAHTEENLARLSSLQNRPEASAVRYERAFEQFGQLLATPDQLRVATLRANAAGDQGNDQQRRDWLDRARQMAIEFDIPLPAVWHTANARALSEAGETRMALSMLEISEPTSQSWTPDLRLDLLEQMAELHQRIGNLEQALHYRMQLHQESLDHAARLHDRQLTRDRVLFEVAEKQRDLERLQSENDFQRLTIDAQRARTGFVAVSGLAGLGLVILGAAGLQRRRGRLERARRQTLERTLKGYQEAADALRTSRTQLQQLLDFNADALLTLGPDRRVVFANTAAKRLLGSDCDPVGLAIDDLFVEGTESRLDQKALGLLADTRAGVRLELNMETLSLEEELQVLNLKPPQQAKHASASLIPQINRHFARMQSFSSLLQACLNRGEMPQELEDRWQAIDQDIQSLIEQCEPVQNDTRQAFREALTDLMCSSLEQWEKATGKSRVDLAESSGIWRITIDEGRLRTRAMDRYFSLARLPRNPRWREVVRTAYFVLAECPEADRADLQNRIDAVLERARKLGLT